MTQPAPQWPPTISSEFTLSNEFTGGPQLRRCHFVQKQIKKPFKHHQKSIKVISKKNQAMMM